jgi:hypothetical protein
MPCHAVTAASVNHTVTPPRRTSAASYSGQFVTRYLALENLWRWLSVKLYGVSFRNQQCSMGGQSYGPGASLTILRAFTEAPNRRQ